MSHSDYPLLPWFLLLLATLIYSRFLTALAHFLSSRNPAIKGLDRKLFHVGIFSGAAPAQLFFGFWGVSLYGTAVALTVLGAIWRGRKSRLLRVLAREEDELERKVLVFIPLAATAVGGLSSVLLVGEFAIVGFLACGWGDAAGELVGRGMGRRPYKPLFSLGRRPRRTLEGSLAVLALGTVGAWAALGLLHVSFPPALGAGLGCGIVLAAAEAVSGKGTDNFWGLLLPSILAWWLLG